MASGMPIIASTMPAHATLVEPEVTGMLCDSAETYRQALEYLEDNSTNLRLGEAARQFATSRFGTWGDCAQRYIRIYRTLLGETVDE